VRAGLLFERLRSAHRRRGQFLPNRSRPPTWRRARPAPAEKAFETAIAIAKEQRARSFGLQAALSLAKLYQSTNHYADAHAVLVPALEGFAPTPEMPEVAEAVARMERLA
jgi:hypothetical protein